MRDNLNLVPITDKNGVTTTRWKKNGGNDTATGKPMPAPELSVDAVVSMRTDIHELLRDAIMQYGDNPKKFINTASAPTIAYVRECLLDESKPDYFAGQVSCLLSDNTEEHVVEAYLHLYDFHDGRTDDMEGVAFLRGALNSGTNPPKGYDRNDEARAESIKNMFRFIHETDTFIYATDNNPIPGVTSNTHFPALSTGIEDRKIADYIIKHGDQIDQIIDIANDHPKEIEQILQAADNQPEHLEAIRDLIINHPERLEGRDFSDLSTVLEASKDWTAISEGIL